MPLKIFQMIMNYMIHIYIYNRDTYICISTKLNIILGVWSTATHQTVLYGRLSMAIYTAEPTIFMLSLSHTHWQANLIATLPTHSLQTFRQTAGCPPPDFDYTADGIYSGCNLPMLIPDFYWRPPVDTRDNHRNFQPIHFFITSNCRFPIAFTV